MGAIKPPERRAQITPTLRMPRLVCPTQLVRELRDSRLKEEEALRKYGMRIKVALPD